jgi:uncharacterized membrane protein YtjA (UPF0391 family)
METELAKDYYPTQCENLKKIKGNIEYQAFGIEWLIRYGLQLFAFIAPAGIVKWRTDGKPLILRRKDIEWFVFFKVVFIFLMVHFSFTKSLWVLLPICYLSLDTLHALLCRIFLDDLWRKETSPKRNLLLAFVNYLEIILCFAAIYHSAEQRRSHCESSLFVISDSIKVTQCPELTPHLAVYFSFVTAATVGYGDISPKTAGLQRIVCVQIFLSLFLIAVIVANLMSNIRETGLNNLGLQKKAQQAGNSDTTSNGT